MNCPFYGHALFLSHAARSDPPFILFPQNGNQCGMITTSHTPCRMEMEGDVPEWTTCILIRAARCEQVV